MDTSGIPFEVKDYQPADRPFLEAMYDNFSPKASFQGMPPANKDVRDEWIHRLIQNGHNLLAWQEGSVIGHVVILPDFDKGDAEYLIFVSQTSRGKGVGKALTVAAIQKAVDLGLHTVWLTVDAYNFRGIRLYKKSGFIMNEFSLTSTERMMTLKLSNGSVP